jgi:type I restriction enzyme, S subunit
MLTYNQMNNNNTIYKDSPLGKIPVDWEVKALRELGTFSKGKGILKEQVIKKGLPCIRYGEIYTTYDFIIKDFKSFISADIAKESKEIKRGDILFAGSGETAEEIGKAVAYTGDEKAYAGGDVIILSTKKELNAECLSYALETDIAKKQKRFLGQGNSVVHIYPSDLVKIKLPIPPLPEQKAIAHVLGLMDSAITTNNRLISQKELQKKWLMQQLLSEKLIVKNEKWCKSGVRKVSIGEVAKMFSGGTPSRRNPEYFKGNIPWIKSGEVNNFEIYDTEEKITTEAVAFSTTKILDADTILLALYGATAGVVGITRIKAAINQAVLAIIPDESIIDKMYLLRCLQFQMPKAVENLVQGGQPNLSGGIIFHFSLFIINSIEEQTAIARVLQAADKEIQLLKAKTEKLREQKKGLMQVLLTGKKRIQIVNN